MAEVAATRATGFRTLPREDNEYLLVVHRILGELDARTRSWGLSLQIAVGAMLLPPAVIVIIIGANLQIGLIGNFTIVGLFVAALVLGMCFVLLHFIYMFSDG